jgi:hypothetical protein
MIGVGVGGATFLGTFDIVFILKRTVFGISVLYGVVEVHQLLKFHVFVGIE